MSKKNEKRGQVQFLKHRMDRQARLHLEERARRIQLRFKHRLFDDGAVQQRRGM